MEPYKRQQRNEKENKPKARGNKAPIGEIRMILRGLVAGGSSKSPTKAYAREVNSVHSQFLPSKMSRNSKSDIVFSEKDVCGIR